MKKEMSGMGSEGKGLGSIPVKQLCYVELLVRYVEGYNLPAQPFVVSPSFRG